MTGTTASELDAYDRVTHAAYRRLAELGGGSATTVDGLLLAAGPHPKAYIVNAAFRVEPLLSGAAVLTRVRDHYDTLAFGFAINTTAHADDDISAAAIAAGWERVISLPAMVVRQRVQDRPTPAGAVLRVADPDRDTATFGNIAATCFADSDEEADAYRLVFDHPELLGGTGVSAFIASIDGRDAAAAWSIVDDGAATVGWVGTLPEFRRRGLGDVVTRAATNAAFDGGAMLVTLQASPSGEPVYAAMGYETISSETIWSPPSGAAGRL
jgi:ribosomal protein S18 acetylase RimI-like enzyme